MKDHAPTPHPGPFRFMRVDSEIVGILIAVGFVVMGIVDIPIAKWFLIAGVVLGVGVAVLLRFFRTRRSKVPLSLRNLR